VGFEPTIPAFEQAKRVHVSDRPATVIGGGTLRSSKNKMPGIDELIRALFKYASNRKDRSYIFSDIKPYSLVKVTRLACCLLHTGFLLGLLLKPEDGGDMFFRNVG
jgi:hypothetical protein